LAQKGCAPEPATRAFFDIVFCANWNKYNLHKR
jgi:hypothetical protein